MDALISDLKQYARLKDWPAEDFSSEYLDDLFREFYKHMNERFQDKFKFVIFDDAELPTEVLDHVDRRICKPLYRDNRLKEWKIVITTQNCTEDWLARCDYLSTDDFITIDGFSDEEMKKFLRQNAKTKLLTDSEMKEIKESLGSRPLMLHVLQKDIEGQKVRL